MDLHTSRQPHTVFGRLRRKWQSCSHNERRKKFTTFGKLETNHSEELTLKLTDLFFVLCSAFVLIDTLYLPIFIKRSVHHQLMVIGSLVSF